MKTKMNVLVATILAALAAQAAVAASEGGDTWSDVQVLHEQTVSRASSGDGARALRYAAPIEGPEDSNAWPLGDTWSHVRALHEQTVRWPSTGNDARALSYAAPIGGSEGGDTWSRVQPHPESQSTRTAAVPAKPAL